MSTPSLPHDMSRLSADEREVLRVAWRGPWGDAMVTDAPPRLVDAVERIVAARLRGVAAELSAMRDHSSPGCDCDNCAPWADAAAVVLSKTEHRRWCPDLGRWVYPDEPEYALA